MRKKFNQCYDINEQNVDYLNVSIKRTTSNESIQDSSKKLLLQSFQNYFWYNTTKKINHE